MQYTIIGSGIIGLSIAFYLSEAGAEVTIVDKGDLSSGCSFGNAGMIVPSHFVPMATPGVIAKGLRWMFDAKSPFYIKPRLNWALTQWLWAFYRSCHPQKVEKAIPVLRDLSWLSKKLYKELAAHPALDFGYEERGLLMLYQSAKAAQEEIKMAEQAEAIGVAAQVLSPEALQKLDGGTTMQVRGGVYYPGDAHLAPHQLMEQLIAYLRKKGVSFLDRTVVNNFSYQKNNITHLLTQDGQKLPVQQVVMAGGAWTPQLLRLLRIKMLLQDGKGYSITLDQAKEKPRIPSILTEAKVAITPMGNQLRIGGTLEISNLSTKINLQRVQGIIEAVPRYFPKIRPNLPETSAIWHGFRPCTPDGLPYIGSVPSFDNLTIATGHAMMGLSLGPATGKLVAEHLLGHPTSLPLTPFNLTRF